MAEMEAKQKLTPVGREGTSVKPCESCLCPASWGRHLVFLLLLFLIPQTGILIPSQKGFCED